MVSMNKKLAEYIQKNLVGTSWGEFDGVREPTFEQLCALKTLVNCAFDEARTQLAKQNNS